MSRSKTIFYNKQTIIVFCIIREYRAFSNISVKIFHDHEICETSLMSTTFQSSSGLCEKLHFFFFDNDIKNKQMSVFYLLYNCIKLKQIRYFEEYSHRQGPRVEYMDMMETIELCTQTWERPCSILRVFITCGRLFVLGYP